MFAVPAGSWTQYPVPMDRQHGAPAGSRILASCANGSAAGGALTTVMPQTLALTSVSDLEGLLASKVSMLRIRLVSAVSTTIMPLGQKILLQQQDCECWGEREPSWLRRWGPYHLRPMRIHRLARSRLPFYTGKAWSGFCQQKGSRSLGLGCRWTKRRQCIRCVPAVNARQLCDIESKVAMP